MAVQNIHDKIVRVHLVKYSCAKVSGLSEVPRFVWELLF